MRSLPELAAVDVQDVDRFLNDLKLSPYWKVVKGKDGGFVAKLRSKRACDPGSWPCRPFPVSVSIVFRTPADPEVRFAARGEPVALDIYNHRWDSLSEPERLGRSSRSELALRLSRDSAVYLVLAETGDDPERSATFSQLPGIVRELAGLVADRSDYRVESRYEEFFEGLFPGPRKEADVVRIPRSQGRDDFHGYLRTRRRISYDGINLMVSHPVICAGECTRDFSRRRKAEYLGTPYHDGDLVYFRLADNAVYLNETYTQRYGGASGSDGFEAKIEILNGAGVVLFETRGRFVGWDR